MRLTLTSDSIFQEQLRSKLKKQLPEVEVNCIVQCSIDSVAFTSLVLQSIPVLKIVLDEIINLYKSKKQNKSKIKVQSEDWDKLKLKIDLNSKRLKIDVEIEPSTDSDYIINIMSDLIRAYNIR